MNPARTALLGKALALTLLIGLGWGAFQTALYAGYLIGFPYQLEARESAQLRSALAFQEGRNPWAPQAAAADYNCYGALYPWVAAKLLPRSAMNLGSMRALNLAALVLASLLLGAAARRLAGTWLAGGAAALATMGAYLFFVTPTARSDGFAALLFLAPLALLALRSSPGYLALGAVIAALAFFTKPYAAVAGPLVACVLWAQGRPNAAWLFGAAWAGALAVMAAAVQATWPGYLEATVGLHANASAPSMAHLARQTWLYGQRLGWPLALLMAWALIRLRPSVGQKAWAWSAALVALLLTAWLGWHNGAFLQYYTQLLHPTALLAVAALWGGPEADRRWLHIGLVVCAVVSVSFGSIFLPRFQAVDLDPWRSAEALISTARDPLAPGLLTSVVTEQGKRVYDNGQTEYLRFAKRGPSAPAFQESMRALQGEVLAKLAARSFDLLLIPVEAPLNERLKAGYQHQGQLCLSVLMNMESHQECFDIFLPRRNGRQAAAQGPLQKAQP